MGRCNEESSFLVWLKMTWQEQLDNFVLHTANQPFGAFSRSRFKCPTRNTASFPFLWLEALILTSSDCADATHLLSSLHGFFPNHDFNISYC